MFFERGSTYAEALLMRSRDRRASAMMRNILRCTALGGLFAEHSPSSLSPNCRPQTGNRPHHDCTKTKPLKVFCFDAHARTERPLLPADSVPLFKRVHCLPPRRRPLHSLSRIVRTDRQRKIYRVMCDLVVKCRVSPGPGRPDTSGPSDVVARHVDAPLFV